MQLFVRGFMCVICVCLRSGVEHILCCFLFYFSSRRVYLVLTVSLDCPLTIVPSVFSNLYLVILPTMSLIFHMVPFKKRNITFCIQIKKKCTRKFLHRIIWCKLHSFKLKYIAYSQSLNVTFEI